MIRHLPAIALALALPWSAGAQTPGGPSAGALAAAAEARAAPAPAARPARAPAPVAIAAIRLPPSIYLPPERLRAAAARHSGQRLTRARLAALTADLNALYAAEGIAFAEAIVNRVDPVRGVVEIHLLEARIGTVRYQGRHVRDDYLDYRLGLRPGQPADNRGIAERLNRLSLTDGLAVEAAFAPGAGYGQTDVLVRLAPLPNFSGHVTLDNSGAVSTGRERLALGLSWRSLTGRHDPLNFGASVTRGARSLSLGYSRVVSPQGTRLGIALDASRSRSLRAPVVESRSQGIEIGLTHPLRMEPARRVQLSAALLGFSKRETIAGAPLMDQRGHGLRLGLSVYRGDERGFVSAGGGLLLLSWRDRIAGASLSSPAVTGYLSAARRISDGVAVSLQASAQVALRERMPSRHRFGVSGPQGVRGYPDNLSEGDSGLFLRLQLERAEPLALGAQVTARPYLFLDAGRAWDRAGGRHVGQDALVSAGVGASLGLGPRASGDIWLAKPLRDANGFSAAGEWKLNASVAIRF